MPPVASPATALQKARRATPRRGESILPAGAEYIQARARRAADGLASAAMRDTAEHAISARKHGEARRAIFPLIGASAITAHMATE